MMAPWIVEFENGCGDVVGVLVHALTDEQAIMVARRAADSEGEHYYLNCDSFRAAYRVDLSEPIVMAFDHESFGCPEYPWGVFPKVSEVGTGEAGDG